jgi:hypothetical protein
MMCLCSIVLQACCDSAFLLIVNIGQYCGDQNICLSVFYFDVMSNSGFY